MRSEDQLRVIQLQLFNDLSHMTMSKYRVCGQIVRYRNEMSTRGRFFPRARHSRFRIRNDSLSAIDKVRRQKRPKRKNARGRVAPGIRHQSRAREPVAIQFGESVDRL